jgi:large subunit ribosomal protein L22
MEAKAIGRYLRVPPRKARFVLDAVRGKSASEAQALLKFIPNEAARYIEDVLSSAMANAEHNFSMDRDILRISSAFADGGPSMKRIHPRAMGRAYRILHRTCHITVAVSEDESLKKVIAPKAKTTARPARRAKKAETAGETRAPKAKPAKAETKPAETAEPATPEQTAE